MIAQADKNRQSTTIKSCTELQQKLPQTQIITPSGEGVDSFPVRVPQSWLNRIKTGDIADPLLRQVLPTMAENEQHPDFKLDPVGDMQARRSEGLIHKYNGRVLLIVSGACALHCRYCFRRHFPYSEETLGNKRLEQALAIIAQDSSIHEVILSGGDPLSVNTNKLRLISEQLSQITHVKTLRIHTRHPVAQPERINTEFLAWLQSIPMHTVMVIHSNHAQELTADVPAALAALKATGITLLNQTVLLRGVNDSANILAELSFKLFECGVLPYYLHLLDPVQGATHFDVPETEALIIMQQLHGQLPGYLMPRLVRETAGEPGKSFLF